MMSRSLVIPAAVLGMCFVIGSAIHSLAGPLDPPPGPVTPTYKTLAEVEPRIAINATNTPGAPGCRFKITKPGSYYLTDNIVGAAGHDNAILVEADGVTIDLNGFVLDGAGTFATAISSTGSDITVHNGTVEHWAGNGIYLKDNSNVRDLAISDCSSGISVHSEFAIENCTINDCSSNGIIAECCGVVHNCHVTGAGNNGIGTNSSLTATGCTVTDCGANGIAVLTNATVSDCQVSFCGEAGIVCLGAGSISECSLDYCTNNGIFVNGSSFVTRNLCRGSNSSNGIRVIGADNRIEANNIVGNVVGLKVEASGNIILGNTCSGSTINNYSIVTGNRYGPIIDLTAGGSAAASGNSAPGTVVSTDPWANFAY